MKISILLLITVSVVMGCRKESTPTTAPVIKTYHYATINDTVYFTVASWQYDIPVTITNNSYTASYAFECPIDSLNAAMTPTNSNRTATNTQYYGNNETCNVVNSRTHVLIVALPCEYLLSSEPATSELADCLFNNNLYITFTGWNNNVTYIPPGGLTIQVVYQKYLGYY